MLKTQGWSTGRRWSESRCLSPWHCVHGTCWNCREHGAPSRCQNRPPIRVIIWSDLSSIFTSSRTRLSMYVSKLDAQSTLSKPIPFYRNLSRHYSTLQRFREWSLHLLIYLAIVLQASWMVYFNTCRYESVNFCPFGSSGVNVPIIWI